MVSGCHEWPYLLVMGWDQGGGRGASAVVVARVLTLGEVGDILETFLASPCVATFGKSFVGCVRVSYW